ncbi:MAG: hypothetical protein L0241_28635, partial [Planctomycetia bacterium]|nr:hypothetical protein [Planctomycetia bacterium]
MRTTPRFVTAGSRQCVPQHTDDGSTRLCRAGINQSRDRQGAFFVNRSLKVAALIKFFVNRSLTVAGLI